MHRRPPSPPEPPLRRDRSRSPRWGRLEERTRGVIAAFRKNVNQSRGGKATRRRTRAIHRQILGILLEYLRELIASLTAASSRPIPGDLQVRKFQVEERLEFLESGFPANKAEVLPGLRTYTQENSQWKRHLGLEDLSDIESNRTNDSLSVHSSEPELVEEERTIRSLIHS